MLAIRKRARETATLVVAVTCLAGSPAAAQLHDHLKCYKIKEAASFTATVDLRPLVSDPLVVDVGCKVKVRSRQLCFPVEKDLLDTSGPELDVPGQELGNPFLCYAVRCPAAPLPEPLQMSDQFGTHEITGVRISTLCAPAMMGIPTSTTTTTTTLGTGTPRSCLNATPPNCDGTCNNYNLACAPDGLGSCFCEYVDVWGPCSYLRGVPDCLGSCEGMNTCIEVAGACQCGFAFE